MTSRLGPNQFGRSGRNKRTLMSFGQSIKRTVPLLGRVKEQILRSVKRSISVFISYWLINEKEVRKCYNENFDLYADAIVTWFLGSEVFI